MSSAATICTYVYAFLLGICIRAKLLCHMVCVQTAFIYTAKQFSKVALPIFSLIRTMRFPVLYLCTGIDSFFFFNVAFLLGIDYLTVV